MMKRLAGNETEDSRSWLDQWLNEDAAHSKKYEEVKYLWELSAAIPPEEDNLSFDTIKDKINGDIPEALPITTRSGFTRYAIAASLIGALLVTAFYGYQQYTKQHTAETWLLKTAAAGKMLQFTLPDSTKIWLNGGSRLWYSSKYSTSKLRKVKLDGEAYFDVTHDQAHPFVVQSTQLLTTVYGTSFTVSAYANEGSSSVSVNSGKVGVNSTDTLTKSSPIFLLAEDKLVYNHQKKSFSKSTIHKQDVDAWINGDLIFEQTPLTTVFATLERRFGIQIKTAPSAYEGCKLTARFQNKSLDAILKTLKTAMNIHSKQTDQIIYLEGGDACSNND